MMGLGMIRSIQNTALIRKYLDEHPDDVFEIVSEVVMEDGWTQNEDDEWVDPSEPDYTYSEDPFDLLMQNNLSEAIEDKVIAELISRLGKQHPKFISGDTARSELIEALRGLPLIAPDRMADEYTELEAYFVDSSGFGRTGEPALTFDAFIGKVFDLIGGRGATYFALTSAGQFQVHISAYGRDGHS